MIKIALCDDNSLYIKQLSNILKDISYRNDINMEITTFECGEDLITFNSKNKNYFDILFLDIIMEGINGISTAKEIIKFSHQTHIVFATISKEYALESYSVNASGYILKPYSYESIEEKILELNKKIIINRKNNLYIKSNQDIYTIRLSEVIYFESNLRKITAYLMNGENITFYNKMSNLENEISSNNFVRCHRSYIINLSFIKNIIGNELKTITGITVPISKKYLTEIRSLFTEFIKAEISV